MVSQKPKQTKHREQLYFTLVYALDALRRWWKKAPEGLYRTRILFGLAPVAALFMVEIMNEKNPFTNLNFTETLMNMIWYVMILFFCWLFFGRRRRAAVVYTGMMYMVGVVNHFVIEYRGRILLPQDVISWRTAANVSSEYSFAPDVFLIGAAAIAAVYILLVKFFMVPQKERQYFHKRVVTLVLAALSAAYIFAFFWTPWLPAMGIKAEQWRTQSNGFVLNFSLALRYSRVDKPEGYSEEGVGEMAAQLADSLDSSADVTLYSAPYIASQYERDTWDEDTTPKAMATITPDENGVQPLNIICIMDESFADMAIFDTLETDRETVPFYHSLRKNAVKGWMYSPVTGAGTANVEYEFLTGNSVAFLPNDHRL